MKSLNKKRKHKGKKHKGISENLMLFCFIILLNFYGLSLIIFTISIFNAQDNVLDNSISVGDLSFSLSSAEDYSNMAIGPTSVKRIKIINNGTLDFVYTAGADNFSGELCNYLNLEANLNGDVKYNGALKDFKLEPTSFSRPQDLILTFFSSGDIADEIRQQGCQLKITFAGLQKDFSDSPFVFSHIEEKLLSIFIAPEPVIVSPIVPEENIIDVVPDDNATENILELEQPVVEEVIIN